MAKFLIILLVAFAAMAMVVHSTNHNIDFGFGAETDGHGLIADALNLDEMRMMESESVRRQMAQYRRYISYGAMRRNWVPCDRRGNSYYNCVRHQEVNPYRRGCTRATYCARYND